MWTEHSTRGQSPFTRINFQTEDSNKQNASLWYIYFLFCKFGISSSNSYLKLSVTKKTSYGERKSPSQTNVMHM